jgi:hypothetical protein
LAHRSGSYSEEVRAVLPPWIRLVGQAQVSLVDQCRCLQRVVGSFCAHVTMSETS